MKAGRELDALVAEKVMGWAKFCGPDGEQIFDYWRSPEPPHNCTESDIPPYSTDIAAAFQVIDKVRTGERVFEMSVKTGRIWCGFFGDPKPMTLGRCALAETIPHAICLAALAAVGYNVSGQEPSADRTQE